MYGGNIGSHLLDAPRSSCGAAVVRSPRTEIQHTWDNAVRCNMQYDIPGSIHWGNKECATAQHCPFDVLGETHVNMMLVSAICGAIALRFCQLMLLTIIAYCVVLRCEKQSILLGDLLPSPSRNDIAFAASSIMLRFTDDTFDEHLQSTIGVDFKVWSSP